jgi:hypothetical protein
MATKNDIFLGTELKLNIHIEPIGDMSMDDYNFDVEVYCSPKKVITAAKNEMKRVDEDNYIVLVDTDVVGTGDLKCRITAYIPDADFGDAIRTEVQIVDTGINVVKTL